MHSHKFLDPLLQSGLKVEPKAELEAAIRGLIDEGGGWIDFAQFMSAALYDPKFGYYSSQNSQIGGSPLSGSDFVTAPELTPAFGRALGNSVAQALEESQTQEIWEFGPGTGELARQLLEHLGDKVKKYTLVDLSGELRARQAATLHAYKDKVNWVSELPPTMQGVLIGNEVLDALPVNILKRQSGNWFEQGVTYSVQGELNQFEWALRATALRPPTEDGFTGDYLGWLSFRLWSRNLRAECSSSLITDFLSASITTRKDIWVRLCVIIDILRTITLSCWWDIRT